MPTSSIQDLQQLRNKFLAVQLRLAALQGRHAELSAQQKTLSSQIALAKARIELAPLASETFTYLQEKAHARAVGEFEDLLSAFVSDVVPDAGSIRLELGTERGAPALDILLDNHGNTEDILTGNGGGLTNVVVTALTYAALARTSNRPFVVLDEPDCWLKASRVVNFTRVIAQVANPEVLPTGEQVGGFQTLMISHNDTSLMSDQAHILTLAADDGIPVVSSTSGRKEWFDETQEGIRWIEVENLRKHLKTRVDLSPGLNVLAGDVNLGKSTLFITALRAIAYGDVSDSIVRHGTNQATIRLGLENNVVVEVVRAIKPTSGFKTLYRKYQDGVLLNEGPMDGRAVPNFITSVLRITRVDDLDIQLRSQKEPVFLLNETAARRARLLSVGREASLLQSLIEKHRLELKRDKDSVKRDELALSAVNKDLRGLALLGELNAMAPLLTEMLEELHANQLEQQKLQQTLAKLTPLSSLTEMAYLALPGLKTLEPTSPVLTDTKSISKLIIQLSNNQPFVQMPALEEPPLPVVVQDTKQLHKLVAQLKTTYSLAHAPDVTPPPQVPVLENSTALSLTIKQLEQGARAQEILARLPDVPPQPVLQDASRMASLVIQLQSGHLAEKVLNKLPPAPEVAHLQDAPPLRARVQRIKTHDQCITTHTRDEAQALTEEKNAQRALHNLQHELGVCPVCNNTFTD